MIVRTLFILSFSLFIAAQNASAQYIPERGEWLEFSYAKLTLVNTPDALTQKWNSNGWQLMFMRETLFGRRSHWSIGYGLGFTSSYWHTNLAIKPVPNNTDRQYAYLPSDSTYRKNSFSSSYIDIPIEFRFRTKSNEKGQYFRFYFGGLIGYRIGSYSKFIDGDYSVKYYKIKDLATWQYGVFARTGFWFFNVYAYYGLNPVFANLKNGPEGIDQMQNLSVGISLSL